MYLLRIESEEELRTFAKALTLFVKGVQKLSASTEEWKLGDYSKMQKLAMKLNSYFSPHPPGHCADCGIPFEDKEQLVSPDSAELREVYLEGMRAIEAKPRIVCRPCWQTAAERRVAEQAQNA